MNIGSSLRALLALLAFAAIAAGCGGGARHEAGEADSAAVSHGAEEDAVTLSPEAIRLAGIRIREIALSRVARTIELPGEIHYNDERLTHITPRYAGVIREVHKRLGEDVRRGEALAVIESNTSLTPYVIEAPIAGRVVEMHASLGEFVAEDHDLFIVADLSTVWADCEIYAGDLASVRAGLPVTITAVGSDASIDAAISYVSPAFDPATRAAVVRAVIPGGGPWRPGAFIRGLVRIPEGEPVPAVERGAVQILGGASVIFVEGDEAGEFRPYPVRTARSDGALVELAEGPPPGTRYVAEGAFDIKAEMVTREAGAHAGHGH